MAAKPILTAGVLAVAFLYSCVGHAGASGYIAVMSLCSVPPAQMKPVALLLDVLVASMSAWQFWRAGHFSWRLFWPFALFSVPFAFLGGYWKLPARAFKIVVGALLLASAARFVAKPEADEGLREPSRPLAFGVGGGLGLLSGLTGTGGGIFLTPLLILMRWSATRTASAVSALFILVNASAALAGHLSSAAGVPRFAPALALAAAAGGAAGSYLGSRRLGAAAIQRLLSVVLAIAGVKLLFG